MLRRCFVILALATVFTPLLTANDKPADPAADSLFKGITFRSIGPAAGGRICRVAGVPGDPLVYYAATASGGVWKSTDGGIKWKPIFDDQPVSSTGSIAVAPSAPYTVYVGAGEANIRGNVQAGNGIYKSTDGGKTWAHVWKQVGQIGTITVHPTNPDICFAAVLGHAFGPNGERGVYRTLDGGKTWKQVLFKDRDTGASDVCFDPSNPTIVFAGLWQARRRPWELTSGGPGSGLYVSRDGGDTWTQLGPFPRDKYEEKTPGKGLPEGPWGKVGVAVAPSDGDRVYAVIEAEDGGLYRSDDGGQTWSLASGDRKLRQRAWYYSTITVDPKNADVVWCPQVQMLRSIDGGHSFGMVTGMYHGDNHDMWIDPQNPRRMIIGNDGGVNLSTNGGRTWFAPPLPISQFYHINVDTRTPYHISGTMQDIGCAAGPSNSLNFAGIRLADWYSVGGGETGYTLHDPKDPNIVYAGEYAGIITRYDHRLRQARNVSIYPDNPSGHGAEDMKYRFRWPAPIAGSPHDPKAIYHAGNVLFKSTDGGQTWATLSPDLTRNDKSKQKWSGGPITGDNTTAEFYCTISAVAESPKRKDLIWVGSDDGLLHLTRDGGKSWANLTDKLPPFPEWGTIKMIEPSRFDAGTAYVVIDAHLLDDTHPYLFRTNDYGQTWQVMSDGLPQDIYLHAVREDPAKQGLLLLGTERGVNYSTDGGVTWHPLKLNLPTVAIHDMVVKDNDLILGTNGRSIWVLDDLSPLRALTAEIKDRGAHLFEPEPAVRWAYHGPITGHDYAAGENPPVGAVLHYYLKKKPKDAMRLEIRDARDNLVTTLIPKKEEKKSKEGAEDDDDEVDDGRRPVLPAEPGVHRVAWPLTHDGAKPIKKALVDMGDPTAGIQVNPGTYTLKLVVDGESLTTKLLVKPDPRAKVSANDLEAQQQFAMTLRSDLNTLSATVERLRLVRKQLADRNQLLNDVEKAKPLVAKSKKLIETLDALEGRLHNPKAQITYDILAMKGGAKLYSRLSLLYALAIDAAGAPTQGMRDVYADLEKELKECTQAWADVVKKDLPAMNRTAKRNDWPVIFVPPMKEAKP
jgi:photosystem II stability/assembly factor-like uncharacterized protein